MDTLFFVASKLVSPLLRIESWIFLALLAGFVLLARGRLRAGRRLVGVGLAFFAVVTVLPISLPVLNALEARYSANPDPGDVAGIVVLGGGEDTLRSARFGQPLVNEGGDRFIAALILARQHPRAQVIFSGGIGSLDQAGPSGAEVARRLFVEAGLEPERLVLESRSRNTAENAQLSAALRGDSPGRWLLVTSAFHMPRAVESFCAAGWSDLVPWPTDYRGEPFAQAIGWSLGRNLGTFETSVREVVGLSAYRVTGRAAMSEGCLAGG